MDSRDTFVPRHFALPHLDPVVDVAASRLTLDDLLARLRADQLEALGGMDAVRQRYYGEPFDYSSFRRAIRPVESEALIARQNLHYQFIEECGYENPVVSDRFRKPLRLWFNPWYKSDSYKFDWGMNASSRFSNYRAIDNEYGPDNRRNLLPWYLAALADEEASVRDARVELAQELHAADLEIVPRINAVKAALMAASRVEDAKELLNINELLKQNIRPLDFTLP